MSTNQPEVEKKIIIRILTTDKKHKEKLCSEVILPTSTGTIGILKNHAPLLSVLDIGVLRLKQEHGLWTPIVLYSTGVAYIKNNIVQITVPVIEEVIEEDLDQLTKMVDQARLDLEQAKTAKTLLDTRTNLKVAIVRFEAKRLMKLKKQQLEKVLLEKGLTSNDNK